MTKIFCDIADFNLIRKFNKKKIVKGFTTNPSLMRKAGAKSYSKYSKEILNITKKPISFEVFADDPSNMILQGKKINNWGKNIFVKVPVTNSKGKFMGEVISSLNKNKVKLNVTAVYNSRQTEKILKKLTKEQRLSFQYLQEEWQILAKIQFRNLKKVSNCQRIIKMLKYYGQALENLITTYKQKN